ncbi:MAG: NADH-quinone oxidoreductase subunit NuoK [Bacteroidota bacterium]|jgi:NADH-quinone oxidoreductase subunit K
MRQQYIGMPINYYLFLAIALFCIGMVGVLTRRNAIIIFMCLELMLNAVNLLLVAFSKMHHAKALATNPTSMVGADGQLFVFFIMVVAAAEVTVGLAIIVMMYRNIHSVDINFLNRLKH